MHKEATIKIANHISHACALKMKRKKEDNACQILLFPTENKRN